MLLAFVVIFSFCYKDIFWNKKNGSLLPDAPLVTIEYFVPQLIVITSKQRPRKLTIHGSDGNDYAFLLKGHEDLRQDERVMQVCIYMTIFSWSDSVSSFDHHRTWNDEHIFVFCTHQLLWTPFSYVEGAALSFFSTLVLLYHMNSNVYESSFSLSLIIHN